MDTDAINLLVELAGRSTSEREEHYAKWQLPTAVRQEIESLLRPDGKAIGSLADHVPSVDLGTLFKTVRSLDGRPPSASAAGPQPVVIGRYEVVRLLGRGGMADVYLARDPILDREVAVKLIGGGVDDDAARRRLVQEARASGRLRHANIITIFDVGEQDGRPYIAMEYAQGETLRSLIRRRAPLPLSRRLELIEGACAGLAHAHRAGVVHLDIKPDNLILDEAGIVKVLDFGIARVLKSEVVITRHIVGTLRYMSPEQVAGGPLDRRSDVFSLASSFFELVTYSPAYEGSTQEIVTRIAIGPVPRLADVAPGIDSRLDALVARAMALEPSNRYDDLEEFRADLARLRSELDPGADASFAESIPARSEGSSAARPASARATPHGSTRAPAPRSIRRLPAFASLGALAGLAAGAGAFWMFGTRGAEPGSSASEVQVGNQAAPEAASGIPPPDAAPAPGASAAPEQPTPQAAANEDVWRRLALGDRQGVLQLLQAPGNTLDSQPDSGLASSVLEAVRTSVLQARRTAGAAPGTQSIEPYRSAEERLARANQLAAGGRSAEALTALWQAADLYAQSVEIATRQPAPTVASPQAPPSTGAATSAPPAAAAVEESVRVVRPPLAAPVDTPLPQPTTPPPTTPPPAETATKAPPAAPVAGAPAAPSDADGILDALGRYEAAYESRDVAQLLQVFPSLARDQVEQLQRTFEGMTTYEIELRDPRVEVQGDVAIVHSLVGRRMVPRVGRAVANEVETQFRLRRAGGAWVITAVTAQ